jgi:short-subunit dehydrogenase
MSTRPRALVTGASAGIGAEIARVLAARGYDLVLVARREDKLKALAEELAKVDVVVIAQDLVAQGASRALFDNVAARGLTIDLLVNNAGVAKSGAFKNTSLESIAEMIALNATSLTELTRLFLDGMLARGAGRILNVASLAAFQPVPALGVYAATKAFVLSFTEALSEELMNTGVSITASCPGLTDTEMAKHIGGIGNNTPPVPGFLFADVKTVARDAVDACLRGEVVHVPGIGNQLAALWSQSQPRWLVRMFGGLLGRQLLK